MKKPLLLTAVLTLVLATAFGQNFNMEFRGQVNYAPSTCSSIWGYVDDLGNEYALVGTSFGVSIVDVTNPDVPVVKFNVNHTPSFWREIKTYGHYAYATNEEGGGLLVIDLSDLPNSVSQSSFIYTDTEGNVQQDGHTVWIDENGRLFIFGGAYGGEGATIFDLTADPLNPPFIGSYENHYIHDGFVRGDTLWASEIYDGQLEILNVADPMNPVSLGSVNTPSHFTHNAWPTHDNHYVFTTDEVPGSFLTSYDVSDLSNITELDRVQSEEGTDVIVHNVHLLNDEFAVTAYYCDGVVIFDVAHPDNMIKVASYDTYLNACNGYNGTWGVYPYLPSGNIIASNIEDGLFVLTPTYVAACWLEGTVTDSVSLTPLNGVLAEILSTESDDVSDLSGVYKSGYHDAGTYQVRFSKAGYATKVIDNVVLTNGLTTNLDVALVPSVAISLTGTVVDSVSNTPIPFAQVHFTDNGLNEYNATADASGSFTINPFMTSEYDALAGKWQYQTKQSTGITIDDASGVLTLKITKGYYDDFSFNFGWTISGNATSGIWELGEPVGTVNGPDTYNPDFDITEDFGDQCYVTGNGGGNVGSDQVNGGHTNLTSPDMDLSNYDQPVISYYRWLADGPSFANGDDSLMVTISNGTSSVAVEIVQKDTDVSTGWVYHEFHVNDYLPATATMKIIFSTGDQPSSENWLEAAIDKFQVTGTVATGVQSQSSDFNCCQLYPNPFASTCILHYDFKSASFNEARLEIYNVIGEVMESHLLRNASGTIEWGKALPDGIYVAKVISGGANSTVFKVVKGL
jgi:choice-of-anchor B domain-containing protein